MNPLERAVLAVAGLLAVLGVIGWLTSASPQSPPVSPLIGHAVERGYFPCEYEDSPGPCYWDASERGNGQGEDFVVVGGEVFYE